jgi:DNA-binding XRE family transcriptional regulator
MSQSLWQVEKRYEQRIKKAVRELFGTQQLLAEAAGVARSTIIEYVNCRPVNHLNFIEISRLLELNQEEIRNIDSEWIEENLEVLYKNREKKELLEINLQGQIKIRQAEIQHEAQRVALERSLEIERLKMKLEHDTRNYKDFLEALDSMKKQMQTFFNDITPSLVKLIHHHASNLLDQMWNEGDLAKRKIFEKQLIELLSSVNDDVIAFQASQDGAYRLPEKTLKLIREG